MSNTGTTSSFREWVTLSGNIDSTGLNLSILLVHWLVAPAGLIRPLPGFVSQVPLESSAPSGSDWVTQGVSTAEQAALVAGTIVETPDAVSIPVALLGSTPAAKQAAIAATLDARFAFFQAHLNAQSPTNIGITGASFTGASLAGDGTTVTVPTQ